MADASPSHGVTSEASACPAVDSNSTPPCDRSAEPVPDAGNLDRLEANSADAACKGASDASPKNASVKASDSSFQEPTKEAAEATPEGGAKTISEEVFPESEEEQPAKDHAGPTQRVEQHIDGFLTPVEGSLSRASSPPRSLAEPGEVEESVAGLAPACNKNATPVKVNVTKCEEAAEDCSDRPVAASETSKAILIPDSDLSRTARPEIDASSASLEVSHDVEPGEDLTTPPETPDAPARATRLADINVRGLSSPGQCGSPAESAAVSPGLEEELCMSLAQDAKRLAQESMRSAEEAKFEVRQQAAVRWSEIDAMRQVEAAQRVAEEAMQETQAARESCHEQLTAARLRLLQAEQSCWQAERNQGLMEDSLCRLSEELQWSTEEACAKDRVLQTRGACWKLEEAFFVRERELLAAELQEEASLCRRTLCEELRQRTETTEHEEAQAVRLLQLEVERQRQKRRPSKCWGSAAARPTEDIDVLKALAQRAALEAISHDRQRAVLAGVEASEQDLAVRRRLGGREELQDAAASQDRPVASEAPVRLHAESDAEVRLEGLDSFEMADKACPSSSSSAAPAASASARTMNDLPITVTVPRFEVQNFMGSKIAYTINVESPGGVCRTVRRCTEFKDLQLSLESEPFADTLRLPVLQSMWIFAAFSQAALERRREQMEIYLTALCKHSGVLLDDTIWQWLEAGKLQQLSTQVVVAAKLGDQQRVAQLLLSLAAETGLESSGSSSSTPAPSDSDTAPDSRVARLAHPAVVEVFQDMLRAESDADTTVAICRLLYHLLPKSKRARQLFLSAGSSAPPTEEDATGALLADSSIVARLASLCRGGPGANTEAVAEAAQQALQALIATLAEAENGQTNLEGSPADRCCVVCLDQEKTHAFVPCGHLCVCRSCADTLVAQRPHSLCPVCRQVIQKELQIFF
eukprot:TRINITY_DN58742_c0_g1_i1.p1 TRINITY_DN58742_c0_g1~~TRINITY_DN58742_c0_g1_i1.p1  ORF type:complete len:957 (-),score=226.41 TRINITY_DN58742_c0_g1_i1:67-2850(-)